MNKRLFYAGSWPDSAALLEGALWVGYAWSIQWSLVHHQSLVFLLATLVVLICALATLMWQPLKLTLARYRVRKRRTEMWMHILYPPMLLAPPLWWLLERLVGNLPDAQQWTLACLLMTVGWLVFLISLLIKRLIRQYRQSLSDHAAD